MGSRRPCSCVEKTLTQTVRLSSSGYTWKFGKIAGDLVRCLLADNTSTIKLLKPVNTFQSRIQNCAILSAPTLAKGGESDSLCSSVYGLPISRSLQIKFLNESTITGEKTYIFTFDYSIWVMNNHAGSNLTRFTGSTLLHTNAR